MKARRPRYAAGFAAMVLLAVLPSACRGILGIETREFDPALADGGAGGAAPVTLDCESYCTTIQANCTGTHLQYASTQVCKALCTTFPKGTLDDQTGDTLGCRIHSAVNAGGAPELDECDAAGPGGNGVCGSNCASFCAGALAICPQDFESSGDCMAVCLTLPDTMNYFVDPNVTPDDNSIQCRLFHLTAATVNQLEHCPHVMGVGKCEVPDGGAGDAGDGG